MGILFDDLPDPPPRPFRTGRRLLFDDLPPSRPWRRRGLLFQDGQQTLRRPKLRHDTSPADPRFEQLFRELRRRPQTQRATWDKLIDYLLLDNRC
jgi:hypothetical protein